MGEEQEDTGLEAEQRKSVRPVLIVSKKTVREYSILLEHLLAGLAGESISVGLVCPPGCDVDSVVSPSVEVIRHPVFGWPILWRQSKEALIERLERFGPSVLHCLCESRALFTRRLSRQLNLPYVLTVNSLQGWFGRLFVSSRRCVRIIVPAKSIGDSVTKIHPRLAGRLEQINIGTFVREGSGCFSQDGRLASMVVAHPLRDVSDFESLLGAVKHLAIEGYEFMLVMIGSRRADKGLRRLITGMGLSQIVVSVPPLRPWHSVLAAGDIFIQPRPSNAFNPLLLEAMSVGSAVAACKGGVDDLIIEGRTAVTFDPDDEISIRKALRRLFDGREFAQQIASGAREYLRENHSVSKMLADTLRVYSEAQDSFEF